MKRLLPNIKSDTQTIRLLLAMLTNTYYTTLNDLVLFGVRHLALHIAEQTILHRQ